MTKKVFQVFWAETAFKDWESIVDYIALHNLSAAREVYQRIKSAAASLVSFPFRGRIVPELQYHNIAYYRELVVDVWRVVYRIEQDHVYVLCVFDSRRNMEDLLLSRFLNSDL